MKVGIRTPSLKKSLKARTTGKLKRAVKKSVNPLYGKKGMGLVTNPKKAVYNKVYNKTTIGISDIAKFSTTKNNKNMSVNINNVSKSVHKTSPLEYKIASILSGVTSIIVITFSLLLIIGGLPIGIFFLLFGIFLYWMGKVYKKRSQLTQKESEETTIQEKR